MDKVYKKIVDTINNNQAEFTAQNIPAIRMVDVYLGQPDDPESFEVFTPGVFVDWQIMPGLDGNPSEVNIDLHLVQEPGAGTESFSQQITKGLEYILVMKTLKKLMNRMRAANITPLTYNGERPRLTEFFKYHIVSYKAFIDADNESIHRPTIQDIELTDLDLTDGKIRQKEDLPPASPAIDTFRR